MAVRVDLRDLAPGEQFRAPFADRISLQAEGTAVEAEAAGEIRVERVGQGVRLQGKITAELPLVCSRCLTVTRHALPADLDEEFSLRPPHVAEGELTSHDFVSWVGPQPVLDVSEVVRQHLQMAVPMAPLCRPDCEGLCPVCGANWNERRCEHELDVRQTR